MMSVVRSVKNQYLGINAHLHSHWQGIGKWNRFHNVHIAHLLVTLKARLLPMGYTAETEESLQIRRVADHPSLPRADILIGDLLPQRTPVSPVRYADVQTLPIEEFVDAEDDEEHPYYAVAIYERLVNDLSMPVAWIELLSPSNKGGSLDAQSYRAKRQELLRNGLVFVELDYLHETPPTFGRLVDYSKQETDAHAYRIVVLDPRPTFRQGRVYLHEFDVDTPMPTAKIPLNGDDVLDFDFGLAYRKTFEEALYGYDLDYRHLPMNFDRYSKDDQARIVARMIAVLEAAANDLDLETGPFPVKALPLELALTKLEALQNIV